MTHGVHEQSEPSVEDRPLHRSTTATSCVAVTYTDDRPTVAVTGRVTDERVSEVADTVRGLIAVGVDELVIDLTRSWDGAGLLPVLARARAELAERGSSLYLAGVAVPEFLAALQAAPLDEVFLVYDAVRHTSRTTSHVRSALTSSVQRRVEWT